jgi:type II restriction/modification system DNA methylase subunit YeeA
MTASEFIAKWLRVELRERQGCQEHFLDLCELVGHPKPAADDPIGERFCFERGAKKLGGEDGWADVWKKGYFGWEYKGKRKDLAAAYKQLNDYREDLENPALLVVCDINRIEVHTNFTNTESQVYNLTFDALATPEGMRTLRAVFFDPESLRPTRRRVEITKEVANKIGELAQALRSRGVEPHAAARFLDRLVFCMFAEDVGLLRKGLFSEVLGGARQDPKRLRPMLEDLFAKMATGGFFGKDEIKRFNGNLFDDAAVLDLLPNEIGLLDVAARPDWSDVEPAIFGSLFERGLDPDKRSQIGAHFTSREDIETLVEPVVMQPLRREWDDIRTMVINVLATGKKRPSGKEKPPTGRALDKAHAEADTLVRNFLDRLTTVKVLDPACGSGNFLYVTLQELMGLEREVLNFAAAHGVPSFIPRVDPLQLHGIEINAYASELAQMVVWIGYLQALNRQGFHLPDNPVLKPMDTIQCRDAILDLSDPKDPKEPDWPVVDFIVSNPPFLGGKMLRNGLGDVYVDKLFATWRGQVPREADLCCYWFEKARRHVEVKNCLRAGLLATQGIRGGANRRVLERIKGTGDIFFAVSDREWVLDGANVHVSMVGFDDGAENRRTLDGADVAVVNTDLTSGVDVTAARPLATNLALCFMGDTKGGSFELEESQALGLLDRPNPHGRPNSDVLVPWVNGIDVTQRHRSMWIIDFGTTRGEADAALYEAPFALVRERVWPDRKHNKRQAYRDSWWRHVEARSGMRGGLAPLPRFLATARVTKYRLFVWLNAPTLPDSQVFAFALATDATLGVLHSRVHEVWARRQGTQLRERESGFRYTPTTCFETFPFPWPPGKEPQDDPPVLAITAPAKELDELRSNWLNPAEWVREEVLQFLGSADGPWARYVHDPNKRGIGTVRYPRLVPRDAECAVKLKARTLTNLYNQRPDWLANAHKKLDAAVFAAYGWDPAMSDDQLLETLLTVNLERGDRSVPGKDEHRQRG